MDDDVLNEFINESREHLATIEADLLTIEEGGADIDEGLVNKVFRAAHSIKGGSGFFGLNKVKELAHKAETILDMLRSRKMAPNAEITNVLLAAFDRLREMINRPKESEDVDITELAVSLTGLASSYLPHKEKAALTESATLLRPGGACVTLPQVDLDRARRTGHYIYCADYDLIHDIDRQGKNVLELFRALTASGEILDCAIEPEAAGTLDNPVGNRLPLRLVFATVVEPDIIESLLGISRERIVVLLDPDAVQPPAAEQAPVVASPAPASPVHEPVPVPIPSAVPAKAKTSPSNGTRAASPEETIRVHVGLLEALMNLAGELVLSRNQLRASIAKKDTRALSVADQRLTQVTSELQDAIMQTRLQPIGNVFGKFPRMLRDIAAAQGKEIQLDIRGKDVALDKSLIEGLSDPLTHMIRNAADHGIEAPDDRVQAGKPRQGTVRIEARHEAGQVVVEIADDGKGIDPERIARSALAKGLITAEKLQGLSARDKAALVFLPGLSTAERVTDISGRGVGMDVVKTNLDRLGGKVEIESEVGHGTVFRIKLPLTLTIIPSLIVSVEGERFAIPQINVEELLRIRPEDAKARIEVIGATEVLLLRDRLIPLLRFANLLGVVPTYLDPGTEKPEVDRRGRLSDRRSPRHAAGSVEQNAQETAMPDERSRRQSVDRRQSPTGTIEIVVVTTGTLTYGLVVGAFHDSEEIVVKPLGRHLKGLSEYAGATTLGDGTVALIVDITGLAAKAGMVSVSGTARAQAHAQAAERDLTEAQAMLLFHNAPDELFATPLDGVRRIERIKPEQVEMAGGRRTLRYRDSSLPLVTLGDAARVKAMGDARELAVIVSSARGREVGLLGAMPVDVVETRATIDQSTHRQPGVAGSFIVQEQTALIADVGELVAAVYPEWAAPSAQTGGAKGNGHGPTLLLAEDSDFFRGQVKRFLEEAGYRVLAAPDGEAAWELLQQYTDEVQVVVTDIEMPRLSGLGLTKRIRADQQTTGLPVIALTSLAGDDHVAEGKAAGVNDYQVKLDRDGLLARLREMVTSPAAAAH